MDAKQVLRELIQSVNEIDLYNFLLLYSNMGIKGENEIDDEVDYGEIRHDQINAWIDKVIEAVHENQKKMSVSRKPEENDRPNIEGMLGLLG